MKSQARSSKLAAEIYSVIVPSELGFSAIIYSGNTLLGLLLPERKRSQCLGRILERFPDCKISEETSGWVQELRHQLESYLSGHSVQLATPAINWQFCTPFQIKVYKQTQKIPVGHVLTYKDIAVRIGCPEGSRAVGGALSKNPFGLIVPCHRVVASNGKPGGFTADGGISTKAKLLAFEGYKLKL